MARYVQQLITCCITVISYVQLSRGRTGVTQQVKTK